MGLDVPDEHIALLEDGTFGLPLHLGVFSIVLGEEAIKALIQPTLQLYFALKLLDQHRVLVSLNLLLYLAVQLLQQVKGYE